MCFCFYAVFWYLLMKFGMYYNILLTIPQLFFVEYVFVVSNVIPFIGYFRLLGNNCLNSQQNLLTWENTECFSFSPEKLNKKLMLLWWYCFVSLGVISIWIKISLWNDRILKICKMHEDSKYFESHKYFEYILLNDKLN